MESGSTTPETSGRVTAFDAHVGLGQVTTEDEVQIMFHCAEIADGSRSIEIGQPVRFLVRSKFGRNEAFAIVKT
ncbi:MAG: cold shock domain-containing protein [Actinomycetota bacterium]